MDNDTRRLVALAVTDAADENGKTRSKLVGPLARAFDHLAAKEPALQAVAKLLGAGRFGRQRILLEVETRLQEGLELEVKVRGPLATWIGGRLADGLQRSVSLHRRCLRRQDGQFSFTIYQPPIPSEAGLKVLGNVGIARASGSRPVVTTATLQVTARCQADCAHCSAARHRSREKEELTTEEWKRVIRQTEQLGVVNIVFTGGEPLLRPDIYELISWVDPREATAMMFTNGLMLDHDHVARLKEAGLYGLYVSLDSPDPERHDALRQVSGCFQRATTGAVRVREQGMLVGISTYATPERLHSGDMRRLIELGRELGVYEITIFDTVPTGRLLREEESRLLSPQDKEELIRMEEEFNADSSYPHIITQSKINGPRGTGCFAGWYQFYMTAYGDMTPCDFTPLTFGNARREAVADIWGRLVSHPIYQGHCNHCRMQDPQFRAAYINRIPDRGPFPFPVELLDRALAREAAQAQPGVSTRLQP